MYMYIYIQAHIHIHRTPSIRGFVRVASQGQLSRVPWAPHTFRFQLLEPDLELLWKWGSRNPAYHIYGCEFDYCIQSLHAGTRCRRWDMYVCAYVYIYICNCLFICYLFSVTHTCIRIGSLYVCM